jgi:flagellar hook-basal body complex protein FliE
MPISPITPISVPTVSPVGGTTPSVGAPASQGAGFGDILMQQVEKLDNLQQNAATQSQALATGQTSDVSSVVASLEQASLSMQLAVQVRNKAVEAYQDLMHMQI